MGVILSHSFWYLGFKSNDLYFINSLNLCSISSALLNIRAAFLYIVIKGKLMKKTLCLLLIALLSSLFACSYTATAQDASRRAQELVKLLGSDG